MAVAIIELFVTWMVTLALIAALLSLYVVLPLSDQFLNFGLRNSKCMWTAWLPTALEIFAFALMYS